MKLVLIVVVTASVIASVATGATSTLVATKDKRGDVRAPDLDVVSASLERRGPVLIAKLTLAKPVRDNAIYAMWLADFSVYVVAKRAAGDNTFFVFDTSTVKQTAATGSLKGRTVVISAPVARFRVGAKPFRFFFSSEATNRSYVAVDRVPDGEKMLRLGAG